MGRKKIQISRITDERNRQVTFTKRKFGLMKKAYELSVLCDCEIALIIFNSSNKLFQYASTDMDKVLLRYTEYNEPHESRTNNDIVEALNKKEHKNGLQSPESPEVDPEYSLTPRTEAKYNKIDEEFNLMMQRSQINGNRPPVSLNNYSGMSVSVPVNQQGGYDPGLMQPSPQMSHASLSPRPGSSSGMLDMNGSNGYPGSTSPLPPGAPGAPGGAPSPGLLARPHTSKTHSPTRPNLRVVIPNSQAQNMSGRPGSPSLNTPVVALQQGSGGGGGRGGGGGGGNTTTTSHHTNPPPPSMNSYSSLNSFSHQDFPLNPDLTLSSLNSLHQVRFDEDHWWARHNNVSIEQNVGITHSSLPHLSVSSSTPPPTSSSPISIKSEPISPPRDTTGNSHLIRPSSSDTGHLSPTPTLHMSQAHNLYGATPTGHITPTSHASPEGATSHHLDYETPLSKRPRMTEGWAT
ncbi:myocyte-specific enhancer factor 2-like isoform X2 [Oratosquilla oratoria]|uniref:myocyte-specific enhancer factor 2-like isoform X2 n=1 Tax=Oratosquilla oratoria TaxID=337810 RepID=UPI003F764389